MRICDGQRLRVLLRQLADLLPQALALICQLRRLGAELVDLLALDAELQLEAFLRRCRGLEARAAVGEEGLRLRKQPRRQRRGLFGDSSSLDAGLADGGLCTFVFDMF